MIMSQILSKFSVSSHNLFEIYVFEVKESISDIPTELPCSGDLENPGQLPVQGVLEGTDDWVLWIFEISSLFMFSRSRNLFLIFLLSYHVWVISKIQVNFRYRRYLKVLMIESYEFLKFLHYLCFRGRGIHFWYSYWTTMFGWSQNPGQLPVQEVLEGTDDWALWIFEISSLFMFLRSRNSLPTFLPSYHVRVTLKIKVNFRFKRYWWFCLVNFHNFSSIHVFEVKKSIADIPTELPCSGDLKNLGQLPVPEVLRSPKEDSSVGMSAMDSLSLKTYIVEKLWNSIRHNHQYLYGPLEPEVDPDFRGHPNIAAHWECQQWIPWPWKHKYWRNCKNP